MEVFVRPSGSIRLLVARLGRSPLQRKLCKCLSFGHTVRVCSEVSVLGGEPSRVDMQLGGLCVVRSEDRAEVFGVFHGRLLFRSAADAVSPSRRRYRLRLRRRRRFGCHPCHWKTARDWRLERTRMRGSCKEDRRRGGGEPIKHLCVFEKSGAWRSVGRGERRSLVGV